MSKHKEGKPSDQEATKFLLSLHSALAGGERIANYSGFAQNLPPTADRPDCCLVDFRIKENLCKKCSQCECICTKKCGRFE